MNAKNFVTIIIRNDCVDEPRVFSELDEHHLQSTLADYASCGCTEVLIARLDPSQYKRHILIPARFEQVVE